MSSFWDVLDQIDGPAEFQPESPNPAIEPNPAIRWRLLARLAKAGTTGLTRSAVRELAGARDRARFLAEVAYAIDDRLVESVRSRYRLTPGAVHLIRGLNPSAVTHFPIVGPTGFWE
jgi:hypothetical protein